MKYESKIATCRVSLLRIFVFNYCCGNYLVAIYSFYLQIALADEAEVNKPNEDISDHENEVDQVALESDPEPQQVQKVLYPHSMQQQQQAQQQNQGPGPARSKYL